MAGINYSVHNLHTQTFVIPGTVILPHDVTNPDNRSRSTSVRVTVNGDYFWVNQNQHVQPGSTVLPPGNMPLLSTPSDAIPVQPLGSSFAAPPAMVNVTVPPPELIPLTTMLNDRRLPFSGQAPINLNGVTLIPARETFAHLGFTAEWNQSTQTVTLTKGRTILTITAGSSTYTINGFTRRHDDNNPAEIINGTLMVPFLQVLTSIDVITFRDTNNVLHIHQT
jgi:hypothetical protein